MFGFREFLLSQKSFPLGYLEGNSSSSQTLPGTPGTLSLGPRDFNSLGRPAVLLAGGSPVCHPQQQSASLPAWRSSADTRG